MRSNSCALNQRKSEVDNSTELKEQIQKKRREYWNKFISNLTLHGYIQFHQATGIRKILWGIILCVMSCFIIYCITLIFCPGKRTEQSMTMNVKYEHAIDFPTVSICNFNPIYNEELFQDFPLNISREEYENFYRNVLSNHNSSNNNNNYESNSIRAILEGLQKKNYSSYKDILPLFEVSNKSHIQSSVAELFGGRGCA